MVDEKRMFTCGHCQTIHYEESEASQCCPPKEVWACGKCEMDWEQDEEGARTCCIGKPM